MNLRQGDVDTFRKVQFRNGGNQISNEMMINKIARVPVFECEAESEVFRNIQKRNIREQESSRVIILESIGGILIKILS